MRGMLNIGIQRGLILEAHDATEGITFSPRRNVRAYVGLKKSRDLSLEGSDVFGRSVFLGFGGIRFPLKCKYVKDSSRMVSSRRSLGKAGRDNECCGRSCEAATAHESSPCEFKHPNSPSYPSRLNAGVLGEIAWLIQVRHDVLDVEVLHVQRIVFDELAPRFHIFSHQRGENGLGLGNVFELDLE